MARNNISTLATKQARQQQKLIIAQAHRRGQFVSNTGVITGSANSAQPWARTLNTYDVNRLPSKFVNNVSVPNVHSGNTAPQSRPWT